MQATERKLWTLKIKAAHLRNDMTNPVVSSMQLLAILLFVGNMASVWRSLGTIPATVILVSLGLTVNTVSFWANTNDQHSMWVT